MKKGRGLFVFVISGDLEVEGNKSHSRDSVEITDKSNVPLQTHSGGYILLIDIPS